MFPGSGFLVFLKQKNTQHNKWCGPGLPIDNCSKKDTHMVPVRVSEDWVHSPSPVASQVAPFSLYLHGLTVTPELRTKLVTTSAALPL